MIENPPSNAEALGWIPGQGTTIPCASEQLSPSASHNKNPVQPKKKKKNCNGKEYPWWLSGKESSCNARDAGSVLGLGKFPGEGNGFPLQCSFSFVHSSILAW